MKINPIPRFVINDPTLQREMRNIATQINNLAEGRIEAIHNAATAAPTSGKHIPGDFIKNSAPAELGAAGSKYVIEGWMCIAAGDPGTWTEKRFLTGN